MEIIFIALLTVLAGGVGTLTGFGTSTIMVPILLFFLPLPQTLLLVGVIHWFGDIWKILFFKKGFNWKLILAFGIAGIAASYLGASIVFSVSEKLLSQILGGFLITYVLFLFLKPTFKIPKKTVTALFGGGLSGFFAGIFGVGGAVRGIFLSAFDLPKAVYISTAGAIALFIDSTRIITYLLNKVSLEQRFLWGLLLFIPASFIGAGAAKKIVDRVPQNKFRMVISIFLLLIGLKFLLLPN
ncbi:MAG: sulfite exporter TauE/SafE family protein [bacterium]|nr:sulfite exporter TauE/SafE family protein [bacterium]